MIYIPAHNNLCSEIGGVELAARQPGELFIGVPVEEILSALRLKDGVDPNKPVPIGELQAWDAKTGNRVWTTTFDDTPFWAPLLTTAGNLVFAGGTSDREFRAFDARTGEILWQTRLSSGVTGVPSSYMVDGVQYIAVQSGWGVDAERMLGGLNAIIPRQRSVPQGGNIWVFALRDQAPAL